MHEAPVATITPTTYSAVEQTALTLKDTGLAISDVDAASGSMTATLSVAEGTLNATAGDSGASVSNSGTFSLTITGTHSTEINNFLGSGSTSTLTYFDNTDTPSPTATLTLTVNDNGHSGTGGNLTGRQHATINITPVNDAPVSTDSANPGTFIEDTDTVIAASTLLANASDPDGDTLTVVGVDSNSAYGGTVTFDGSDIAYHPAANFNGFDYFVYTVSDGQASIQRAATFTVGAVNDAPVITSNGGGLTAAISVAENTTAVGTVAATDIDSSTLTYSIAGGADANLFDIHASTGVLIFKNAPNYEVPADADHDNIYDVTVQVSDGALTDTQAIAVTVTNVDEAPQFFASRQVNIVNPSFKSIAAADNTTSTATGWTASGDAAFNPAAGLFVGGEAAIPDGSQVGFLNGGSISQTTSEALVAGSTYLVKASIGDRLDANFGGGNLQFWAAGVMLASTPLPTPANGTWVTASLQYTVPADLPQIGQLLSVRITSNDIQTLSIMCSSRC